jgi:GT2 family glycosyltransferase
MRDIAVIINSFNRKPLLKSALVSLTKAFEADLARLRIFVFDAGSSDGSVEWLQKFSSEQRSLDLRILHPDANGTNSFSAGINSAARSAVAEAETRFLFLYETDNALESLESIYSAFEIFKMHPDVGAIGFTAQKYSGQPSGFGCRFPTPLHFLLGPRFCNRFGLDAPRLDWQDDNGVIWSHCDVVYTSPLLIRREAWEKTGEFDEENFPFSDSDLDWAWRLKKAGYASGVLKTDAVIHDNQNALSDWSGRRALHFHRARLRLLKKHRGCAPGSLLPFLLLRHSFELFAAFALLGKNWKVRLNKKVHLMKSAARGYNEA